MSDFVASMSWFSKFKMCYGFHSIKCSGEAKSTDEDATTSYLDRLKAIIEKGEYKPRQVFDMDETGLR